MGTNIVNWKRIVSLLQGNEEGEERREEKEGESIR